MKKQSGKAFAIISPLPSETVVARLQDACSDKPWHELRNAPKRIAGIAFVGHVSANTFSFRPFYQFFTNYCAVATGVITAQPDGRTKLSGRLSPDSASKGVMLAMLMLGGGSLSVIGLLLLFAMQDLTYLVFILSPLLIYCMGRLMFFFAARQLLLRIRLLINGTNCKNTD